MNEKRATIIKAVVLSIFLAGLSIVIFAKVVLIQTNEDIKIRNIAEQMNFREVVLKAPRGNLYTSDGILLSTSTIKYNIGVDFKTIKPSFFYKYLPALADSLAPFLGKTSSEIFKRFSLLKQSEIQYYPLLKNISHQDYLRIKNFPIFEKGQAKGGFIVEKIIKRSHTVSGFGNRIIGYDDERGKAGLEGAFSEYLRGTDGKRVEQRINYKQWKPTGFIYQQPEAGKDVYTTLNMRIQDIAYSALKKQLIASKAEHGCAVVMEVKTGKIRAMANLTRLPNGEYADVRNYAVWESSEPGSTFKVMSLLAAMNDGYLEPSTTVDVGDGSVEFFGNKITDEHSRGEIDLTTILAESSNIGVAKLIYKFYSKSPKTLFETFKRWRLHEPLEIEIPGEGKPLIPAPGHSLWSLKKLPWISFGYGVSLTPLQILTFYNGIANDGTMLKPTLLEKVMKDGGEIFQSEPEIRVENMASVEVIQEMKRMLTVAVEKGTAASIHTPNLKMAGKTGTTRLEYWKKQSLQYQSSFCGFFPSDNPQYSCIVVIHKPSKDFGFYGSKVAAPVFKEIAGRVFLKQPINFIKNNDPIKNPILEKAKDSTDFTLPKKIAVMPDITGLPAYKIIPQLENAGLRVVYTGAGKIKSQSLPPGFPVKKNYTIYLELE